MKDISFQHGISIQQMENWDEFLNFINNNLDYRHFVWRGQADSSWLLEPTLDRVLRSIEKIGDESLVKNHLKNFKYAIRGRRGSFPIPLQDDNEWWALGQHQNLYTPLLDWTKSPFVAAFFSFSSNINNSTNYRAIYGISQISFERKSKELRKKSKNSSIVEFIEPLSDENMRLVSQGGLFTKSSSGTDIETWVKDNFDENEKRIRMWKILIPETEQLKVIKSLNRMNINHASLFPDIYGASMFVNTNLEIEKY